MFPDYYKLFGIEKYGEFNLTDSEIYDCLQNYLPTWSLAVLASKFETGIYILRQPYIKKKYDYLLRTGWISIVSDPIVIMYVAYIIFIVRIRTIVELWSHEIG